MQTDEEIGKVAAAVPVIICILPPKYFSHISFCVGHLYGYFESR